MNSFEQEFLERQPLPHSLLRTIRLLGEYRGKEALFIQQTPQVLESLRQVAIIQSTESSNRIEGIEAPAGRIKKLVERKTTPKNRSEQEIAGYRDALATIHANHANMPFTTGVVLQLHRDLYQFVARQGGRWKMTDNEISETRLPASSRHPPIRHPMPWSDCIPYSRKNGKKATLIHCCLSRPISSISSASTLLPTATAEWRGF